MHVPSNTMVAQDPEMNSKLTTIVRGRASTYAILITSIVLHTTASEAIDGLPNC